MKKVISMLLPARLAAVLFLSLACVAAYPAPVRYEVAADPALSILHVHACFPAPVPEFLEAMDENAADALTQAVFNGSPLARESWSDNRIALPVVDAPACINYEVDIPAAEPDHFKAAARKKPPWVLLRAGAWLWLPPATQDGIQLAVKETPDLGFSLPWPVISRSKGEVIHDLDVAPAEWPAMIAIGRMQKQDLRVPGAVLRLALLQREAAADNQKLLRWVQEGAEAVAGAYGRFPILSPQVMVVPVGPSDETVPWGQVLRGGGPAAHLFVDDSRSSEQLRADWVLVHELSHMLHPNLHGDGLWLAEGLASYYQNVLRARSGALEEQAAWRKLHEGFERGRKQSRPGLDLQQATKNMMRERLFMRVYWTGAAWALQADLALRARGLSLDEALERFNSCCSTDLRMWPAREFVEKLDTLAGGSAMQALYEQYVSSDHFPGLEDAYATLGISVSGDELGFSPGGEGAELRRAIMGSGAELNSAGRR